MRQSAAIATYQRAYVVCFERWRAWGYAHWSDRHRARKRYSAAISVTQDARARCDHASYQTAHVARMTCGQWLAWIPGVVDGIVFDDRRAADAWCARPFGGGVPVERIAG